MEINLELQLPRDEASIPVVRHLCRNALRGIGVDPDCGSDIEVALCEACTNALAHSGPAAEYTVHLGLDDRRCVITVTDAGRGFDGRSSRSDPAAERGRGVELMRALVDRVIFHSDREAGTIVRLEKDLAFEDGIEDGSASGGRVPGAPDGAPAGRPEWPSGG
ncbi:MAG: ATP-binding protein [Actinomycetota bacterium]|nr:ATP-binding protein [Actinomycetota bacterium]